MSEATRKKMSEARRGRKMSDEACRKISEAKKGKPNGREGKKGKDCTQAGIFLQISLETGEIVGKYYGIEEMSRMTGFAKSPVKRASIGKQKKSYGYKWVYLKGVKDVTI